MSIKSRVENCIRRLYRRRVENDIDTVQIQIQDIERRDSMTKKYPSQKKYEAENPAITIRLKKREKEQIKEMAEKTEKSVSELVRMALLDLEIDFSNAIAEAEKRGYEKAKDDYGIFFPCKICGGLEYILPNSPCHEAVVEFLKERGWGHQQCHKQ